jgi:hypothetical protein
MGLMADVNAGTEITKSETTERSSGSPENEGLTLLRHHSWIVCAAGDDKYRLLTFVPPCWLYCSAVAVSSYAGFLPDITQEDEFITIPSASFF